MNRLFPSTLCLVLLVSWLAVAGPLAFAAPPADRLQPVQILSDESRYEEAQQLTTLSGNVVLTQGSLIIRAARMQLKQGPEGSFTAFALGDGKGPASFAQSRGASGQESIQAQADRIEYESQSQTLRLTGQAVLRRLMGSKITEETVGQLITYQGSSETFSVSGGQASPSNPGGRVRTVITPRDATAPSQPASAPPVLQPASKLSSPPKGQQP